MQIRKTALSPLRRFGPPLAYMAGIYLLSSIPDLEAPRTLGEKLLHWTPANVQNLLHVPLYGGLAALWYRALFPSLKSARNAALLTLAITLAYAFFDEWHQLHVPGRFGSLTDIALNLVGIGGTLFYLTFSTRDRP